MEFIEPSFLNARHKDFSRKAFSKGYLETGEAVAIGFY